MTFSTYKIDSTIFDIVVTEDELNLIRDILSRVRLGGADRYSEAAFNLLRYLDEYVEDYYGKDNVPTNLVSVDFTVEDSSGEPISLINGDYVLIELDDLSYELRDEEAPHASVLDEDCIQELEEIIEEEHDFRLKMLNFFDRQFRDVDEEADASDYRFFYGIKSIFDGQLYVTCVTADQISKLTSELYSSGYDFIENPDFCGYDEILDIGVLNDLPCFEISRKE
jgi:hypothetical protein